MPDVKLYCGDCLEYMKTLEAGSVDAVVTDPPYGIGLEYGVYVDTQDNLKQLIEGFMPLAMKISRNTVVTCGITNLWLYPPADWVLSWQYPGGSPRGFWGFRTWQPVLVYGKDPKLAHGLGCHPDSVTIPCYEQANGHPANKPIKFMRWLLARCTLEGDTVFDPFMGSGTTGVACMQLGRNFIGCEIDPHYFAIAEKRITEARAQLALPMEM